MVRDLFHRGCGHSPWVPLQPTSKALGLLYITIIITVNTDVGSSSKCFMQITVVLDPHNHCYEAHLGDERTWEPAGKSLTLDHRQQVMVWNRNSGSLVLEIMFSNHETVEMELWVFLGGFLVSNTSIGCMLYIHIISHSSFALFLNSVLQREEFLSDLKNNTQSIFLKHLWANLWSVSMSAHLLVGSLERRLPRPPAAQTRGSNRTDNMKQLPPARPSNLVSPRHTCYAVTGHGAPKLAGPPHPHPPHILPSTCQPTD